MGFLLDVWTSLTDPDRLTVKGMGLEELEAEWQEAKTHEITKLTTTKPTK